jgi:hypothetical protein
MGAAPAAPGTRQLPPLSPRRMYEYGVPELGPRFMHQRPEGERKP